MIVIGLTGGILSGKSTVARILGDLGAAVIDADKVGHDCYRPGTEGWEQVVRAFGGLIVDSEGHIDRHSLSSVVFDDAEALAKLNGIMHPLIRRRVEQKIEEYNKDGVDVVVVEAPVLLEAGWSDLFDQIWVTTVPEAVAAERFFRRSNLSEDEAIRRIGSQMKNEERIEHADRVIDTGCSLEQTRSYVEKLWSELKGQELAFDERKD